MKAQHNETTIKQRNRNIFTSSVGSKSSAGNVR